MKLNCIITDDEPVAMEIIEEYVNLVPYLSLVAKCKNAMETHVALQQHKTDILFMDIEMPEINGIDFVRSLKGGPSIIFTTAYPAYAIDGFDLEAVDYLLKPVSIDRFLRAVDRVRVRLSQTIRLDPEDKSESQQRRFFFVKNNQELIKVNADEILYVEGMENYVKIHCQEKRIIAFITMKNMEELLSPYDFLRIHRSTIVNMHKVDVVQNHTFCIGDKKLLVGKSYKKAVAEILKSFYSV